MDTRIVYATSHDGVRVACSVRGTGFPLMLLRVPLASNCRSLGPAEPSRQFVERLAQRRQLIMVDLRGSGLADRHPPSQTFEDCIADVSAVFDVLRLDCADILAHGQRSSLAIRFAGQQPERVRRLMLWGPSAGPTAADGAPMASIAFRNLAADDWKFFLHTFAARNAGSETGVPALTAFFEKNSDQADVLAFLDCVRETNIEGDAEAVRCPTLVTELDSSTLREGGHAERLASLIPTSELVYLPNKPMFGWLEDLADAIERFDARLDSALRPSPPIGSALTSREAEVLALLAAGHTNAEIGGALALSVRTVERHLQNAYARLNLRNRAEATRWALTHGIEPAP